MLKALGSRLTYANVVATGALFVALGGGAYALSGIPGRGGVFHGCVSNKTGVLRVVKSASSCRKASGRGQRRTPGESAVGWNQQGQPGLQGVQGLQGVSGLQGQKGDAGPTGPSDIYASGVLGQALSTSAQTEVASLTVPAGSYLIGATLYGIKGEAGDQNLSCGLQDGPTGPTFWHASEVGLTDAAPRAGLSLAGADTFSAPKTIKVFCNQVVKAVSATNTRLWAINTGTLHANLPLPTQ